MLKAVGTFSGVSVDNIVKAREFYVATLGLTLTDDSMGLNLELPGGAGLFVYEKPDHEPASFTVLNFIVEDIDETIDHLVNDHGVTFERYDNLAGQQDERGVLRGKAEGMGPDIAWFKDPAGNVLAVLSE